MISIAIAVVEQSDRYLVGTRGAGETLAGKAEFPGGKVEPGESPERAAARECWEETGLRIEVTRLRREVCHRYQHGELQLFFFDCRPQDPAAIPRAPFRWLDIEALASLAFPAANADVIEELVRESL